MKGRNKNASNWHMTWFCMCKESTKKAMELISEFSKVSRDKRNIQKAIIFLSSCNEKL